MDGSAEEVLTASSPSRDRWPQQQQPSSGSGSGPASLGLGNSDGSPALEYDLWEGQFEFLGGDPRLQSTSSSVGRLAAAGPEAFKINELGEPLMHQQVRDTRRVACYIFRICWRTLVGFFVFFGGRLYFGGRSVYRRA